MKRLTIQRQVALNIYALLQSQSHLSVPALALRSCLGSCLLRPPWLFSMVLLYYKLWVMSMGKIRRHTSNYEAEAKTLNLS